MKQIINNKYLKVFRFSFSEEASVFLNNQTTKMKLTLNDTFGDNHYCCACYHSLTGEEQFILSFSSDEEEDNLSFLFWDSSFIVNTGKNIYFINEDWSVKNTFELTTPLIGFYLIDGNRLLILEEAYLRILNKKGETISSELFDLIVNFSINEHILMIQTENERKEFFLM